ncbi:MAG TPA: NUDIX pyrophosphatase [Candidatus Thermoplasmatota archaeon]|nr:NUDIX pyrophosphatase [Candidatus Thermoplasmatota archaeon]
MVERRSVAVFVFRAREPRFLLLRRIPSRGGFWQPVTGRVEDTDHVTYAPRGDPAEMQGLMACAAREVREETGLKDLLAVIDLGLESRFEGYDGNTYCERAFAAEVPVDAEVLPSDEHDDVRWVGYEDALQLLRWDENREALRRLVAIIDGRAA